MTGRHKIRAALAPGGSTEIPVVVCYEGIYVRDHWEQLTAAPWWWMFDPDVSRQVSWRSDVLAGTDMDWFSLPAGASREERQAVSIEVRGEEVFRLDRRTGREARLARPEIGGWVRSAGPPPGPPMPQSPDEIDCLLPEPDPSDVQAACGDGRNDLAAEMLRRFGGGLFPLAHVCSPLWRCYQLWGFEGLMLQVATRPDLVRHACRRLLAICLHEVAHAAARGAAGMWIEECFTDSISPRDFADLNLPVLTALVEGIRGAGMKSIYYYCGNPHDRWDHLLAAGADALALEEGKKNFRIHIEDVVARVGRRCAVLGNLDAVRILQNASRGELRGEIARQIAAGRRNGGRFILSLGSPVTPDTPVRRVRRYCRVGRSFGQGGAGRDGC